MIFAETDAAMNALLAVLLGFVVVATQIAREWRDSLREKNRAARDAAVKTALAVASEQADKKAKAVKAAIEEVAVKAEAVKMVLDHVNTETDKKLEDVKSTLAARTMLTEKAVEKIDKMQASLDENTAITSQTKSLVNGQRDKILEHITALQKLMEDHGIECPPHLNK